ncbi:hypothetical protein, conserved [Trypanosoma brucei gambiense DAL972]|uniref:Uncharacterized protein n=1 Tax=Trypanosoma brucei gambiense (strain MHOM/CI/86/DAL972) TaxID=679716 RepID=C9ZTK2_TRYB9|nr:hypothetical protein, conserved [Trypanosoma brucei gambiense DAL972]CBH12737.1 hypothetical protein, conserved [Trypanosoma brucei gambiense DAL972]|eukprot:XP_011775017.1 hypothetical protein, conserved [Trypanosoma brucei gambiense DAL972]
MEGRLLSNIFPYSVCFPNRLSYRRCLCGLRFIKFLTVFPGNTRANGYCDNLFLGFNLHCQRNFSGRAYNGRNIDIPSPPAPLTLNSLVSYMTELRLLHRSCGVSVSASRVRFQAREFLTRGIAKDLFCSDTDKGSTQLCNGGMNEECATALLLTCGYFELSIFECGCGYECVELLSSLWSSRLLSSFSPPCSCAAAGDAGRLTLSVLGMLTGGGVRASAENRDKLLHFLCKILLPITLRLVQEESLFVTFTTDAERAMTNDGGAAFSTLISALTKAAVAGWICGDRSSDSGRVAFGVPSLPQAFSRKREVSGPLFHTLAQGDAIDCSRLASVMQMYAGCLVNDHLKGSASQVLRFFTLTQCVPQLVALTDHYQEGDRRVSLVASLVRSVTAVLLASLDVKGTNVSHLVASIASSYARILTFPSEEKAATTATSYDIAKAKEPQKPSWTLFRDVTIGVRNNMLYGNEVLSPAVVLLHLCERVTPFAHKYLFSDLAALLNALGKIYRVAVVHFNRRATTSKKITEKAHCDEGNCGSRETWKVSSKTSTHSRFERRGSATCVQQAHLSPTHGAMVSESTESPQVGLTSPYSLALPFAVNAEDIAEIEGELEVLLTSVVTVMERHMPSTRNGRPVFVSRANFATDNSVCAEECVDMSRKGCATDGRKHYAEDTSGLQSVPTARAKELGGRSRLLKKSVAGKELVLIAEGLHTLSWRSFVAFQDRLLMSLSSQLGQEVLSGRQYASLVCLLLRAPPVLASVVFHAVEDRLKRLIHSDAVTITEEFNTEESKESQGVSQVVVALPHARAIQDESISLCEACAVIFGFALKMGKNALSLLNDLFIRCGNRVLVEVPLSNNRLDENVEGALTMFVASSTWVLANSLAGRSGSQHSGKEKSVISFIKRARDHAAHALCVSLFMGNTVGNPLSLISVEAVANACMMLECCGSRSDKNIEQIHGHLKRAYAFLVSQCDSRELAQLLEGFVGRKQLVGPRSPQDKSDVGVALQLPRWMISSMNLSQRFAKEDRLLSVMFFPFLRVNDKCDSHEAFCDTRGKCLYSVSDVERVLLITQRYCRNFGTLVVVLRLLHTTDPSILRQGNVVDLVLRKVAQVMRRTCKPLDLFAFFAMYGDFESVVSVALRELGPEARCFASVKRNRDSTDREVPAATTSKGMLHGSSELAEFLPMGQITAAVSAVNRLQLRSLRQNWLATTGPLIVAAAKVSREPLEVVLDLAELVKGDDPKLLYDLLTCSSAMCAIDETCNFTTDISTLLRLLLLLQGGNLSNPTVRRLHIASRKLLFRPAELYVPSLMQLAQVAILPSVKGTALGRQIRRIFYFRVGRLLFGKQQSPWRSLADSGGEVNRGVNSDKSRETEVDHEKGGWTESLTELALEHWLVLLRYSSVGKPSSYRLAVELRQREEADETRRRKSKVSSQVASETVLVCTDDQVTCSDDGQTVNGGVGCSAAAGRVDKRFEGIDMFHAFSDRLVMQLRQSLGASKFIAFVGEMVLHAANAAPYTSPLECDGEALCEERLIYEGTAPLLLDARVRRFVRLATLIVEEMSSDLGSFLGNEQHLDRQCVDKQDSELVKKSIGLDLGAVLKFLVLLDTFDPLQYEKRVLERWERRDVQTQSVELSDVFAAANGLPLRHLYRIVQQLPDYWCNTMGCSSCSFGGTVGIHLTNISTVFEYCMPPEGVNVNGDCCIFPVTAATDREAPTCCHSAGIFGSDRPLVTDVWVPLSKARQQQQLVNCLVKEKLLDVTMRCFFREGESPAVTRARLGLLGPRDLTCVLRTILAKRDTTNGDAGEALERTSVTTILELLTDMLPSTAAEDLHNVVVALTPLLSRSEFSDHPKLSTDACASESCEAGVGLKRFLAHVAVVMGNDAERFSVPVLLDMIEHLHVPHRLISPAAAAIILSYLVPLGNETEGTQRAGEGSLDDEIDVGAPSMHNGAGATVEIGNTFDAIVSLLQSIVNTAPESPIASVPRTGDVHHKCS